MRDYSRFFAVLFVVGLACWVAGVALQLALYGCVTAPALV